MSIIYIDLKSAYNTINRKTLFEIIKEQKILNVDETDFLEGLNNKIYFKTNTKNYYF